MVKRFSEFGKFFKKFEKISLGLFNKEYITDKNPSDKPIRAFPIFCVNGKYYNRELSLFKGS